MTYPIPTEAFDDRLAITGTSGAGKTYMTLGAVARLLKRGRAILVDPLGVMYGLRLKADGVAPSEFRPVIFGGPHGDLPLSVGAAGLIGETCATMAESCILDLSELGTKAAERRFMLGFLTALYRHANKDPVHLVIDEADMFAPQKLDDKEGEAAKLLGMMETVVRRGRVKGFIPWLITQRPAVLNKNVLSQADGIIAMKLTASQDRDAIGAWIEGQADRAKGKEILALLPTMNIGEGVVWIPGRSILRTAQFPMNATFDSSRTPKRGETKRKVDLKPLDLGKLKERLATVEAEAKANDPAALKAQVARLTAELARSATAPQQFAPDAKALNDAGAQGFASGWSEGWLAGWDRGYRSGFPDAADQATAALRNLVADPGKPIPPKPPRGAAMPTSIMSSPALQRALAEEKRVPALRPAFDAVPGGGADLPVGERAVLSAAIQFGEVGREQVSILTGYKKSSRDAYVLRLKGKGLLSDNGSVLTPTQMGIAALPDFEPLPTGAALRDFWFDRLPEGEKRILEKLVQAYPRAVERSEIDMATGYKKSSRDAYLLRMKAKRLWEPADGGVRAAQGLF